LSTEITGPRPALGSLAWLERTGGRLTWADRFWLLGSTASWLGEGISLAWKATRGDRLRLELADLQPPDTRMVQASREHLVRHSSPAIANHSMRTGYWTVLALHQRGAEPDPDDRETAWVAALLHDAGLESPPERGDFTLRGVEIVKALAHEHRWSERQTHTACETIAAHPNTRVDPERFGPVAWAMNVGVVGELSFAFHRAQMHPRRIAELEARFPRTDFRANLKRLIHEEARRFPGGRFALIERFLGLILRG
jgi:hypothetical protein